MMDAVRVRKLYETSSPLAVTLSWHLGGIVRGTVWEHVRAECPGGFFVGDFFPRGNVQEMNAMDISKGTAQGGRPDPHAGL